MEPIEFRKVLVSDQEPYQEFLQVLPSSLSRSKNDNGDHVILSPYSMDLLFRKTVQNPMKFRITTEKYITYCSVEEFTAELGTCIMPQWMMKDLDLDVGSYIRIENISLSKGKSVAVRICNEELLSVPDIKATFEEQLRHFVVLAEGGHVPIKFNGNQYFIDIVHCEPEPVIDINNTNLVIDFVPMEEDA